MPQRENQTIVFNIFLHGPPGSGRKTFLHYLVQHGNILDANFLQSIEKEQKQLRNRINTHMKRLKELPRILKQNLDDLLQQNQKFEEAKTYFEIASYRIRELCKSYDEEINRCIKKSISNIQTAKNESKAGEPEVFSSIDIVGSSPNMLYRIHYINETPPDPIQFDNFLSIIDGLIFIWDSQLERIEENTHIFKELLDHLPLNTQYPLVIALNKTDLPNTIRSEDLSRLLTQIQFEEKLQTSLFADTIYHGLTIFETVAPQGTNVKRVNRSCALMIAQKHQAQIQEFQKILLQEVQV